jgi:hypothetical protein
MDEGRPNKPHRRQQRTAGALFRLSAFFLLALAFAPVACRLLSPAPVAVPQALDPNAGLVEPAGPEETSRDEETGIKHLHALLRCFDAGVLQQQFAAADDCLSHAERGIVRANSLTRSHPDFDDLADAIRAARPRFDQAVERDRIAKRNAAIDVLIGRGEIAYDHANVLCLAGAHASPKADDVAELDDSHAALTSLLRAGEAFVDVPRYAAHAQQLTAAATAVRAARSAAAWQLSVAQRLTPPLETGFAAADVAKRGTDAAQQLAAYKEIAQAFAACLQIATTAQEEVGFADVLLIETRLGTLPLAGVAAQCQQTLAQANDRINRFGWEHLIAQLQSVLPAARTQGRVAAEALAAAMPLLAACAEGAPGVIDSPGAERWTFDGPFGPLTLSALRRACAKESTKLAPKQATLAWQVRFEAQVAHYVDLRQAARKADQAPAPTAFGQLAGSFAECRDGTAALLQEPHADRAFRVGQGREAMTAPMLLKACTPAAQDAQVAFKQAQAQAVRADFRSTCHNDEVAVVDREGVPPKVETIGSGRVFVYGPHKRIAFDAAGQRTEESALHP